MEFWIVTYNFFFSFKTIHFQSDLGIVNCNNIHKRKIPCHEHCRNVLRCFYIEDFVYMDEEDAAVEPQIQIDKACLEKEDLEVAIS